MKHISILLLAFFACLIAAPITARAGSRTIYVPPPNGADDTTNIQAALNTCVAHGKNCTVQVGRLVRRMRRGYKSVAQHLRQAEEQVG